MGHPKISPRYDFRLTLTFFAQEAKGRQSEEDAIQGHHDGNRRKIQQDI